MSGSTREETSIKTIEDTLKISVEEHTRKQVQHNTTIFS